MRVDPRARAALRDGVSHNVVAAIVPPCLSSRVGYQPYHPTIAGVLVSWSEMKMEQDLYAEAESLLRDAADIYDRAASTDWRRDYAQALRGAALARLGQRVEGGQLLTSAYAALLNRKASIPAERQAVLQAVERWNSPLR